MAAKKSNNTPEIPEGEAPQEWTRAEVRYNRKMYPSQFEVQPKDEEE